MKPVQKMNRKDIGGLYKLALGTDLTQIHPLDHTITTPTKSPGWRRDLEERDEIGNPDRHAHRQWSIKTLLTGDAIDFERSDGPK
jgi:hypothetical protein